MAGEMKTRISLFGSLDIRIGDVSQHLGISGPTRSLLGYLLCFHNRPARREQLIEMFWPDTAAERRRSSLNSAIWRIKKALKACPALNLDASADCVRLTGADGSGVEVDAIRLETSLRGLSVPRPDSLPALIDALDECEAEPLDGLDDDWAAIERERLATLRIRALTAAMRALAGHRRYDDAIEMGRRILVKEPFRECAFQELMCLHMLNGQRVRALQSFDSFVASLKEELGIPPMAETRALRDYILSDPGPGRSATLERVPSRPGIDELLDAIGSSRRAGSVQNVVA